MKKNINTPFIAFLAWMAALLTLVSIMNTAHGQGLTGPRNMCEGNMEHVKHLPPAYTTAAAVAMAKAIVWNNVHFVTADSPTIAGRTHERQGFQAMDYATCLLQTYAYLTEEEFEMATGVLGYYEAIEWCMESTIYGKVVKPAPLKRPEGVCCGD
jgi:hypothetical protein|tara:strand:- start:95 stop:559 length:465 start_codon:yes stop_codon:yes gene_type:complete